VRLAGHQHFVYDEIVDVDGTDRAVSSIAAAIGEPARARMLFGLMDGRARTSTELAVLADVSPSTASAHLNRLKAQRLVRVVVQGKHRYYNLDGANVAAALEALSVVAGGRCDTFVPRTPNRLRTARTCYDHMAGTVGVSLHDRFKALAWLSAGSADDTTYDLTPTGAKAFEALGIDLAVTRALRRRFACACLDWSERRPHMGGALGAAFFTVALKRRWVIQELDSRVLTITKAGWREMRARFHLPNCGSTSFL
jgi:DNA-binding transcriptional ArsR family regulator